MKAGMVVAVAAMIGVSAVGCGDSKSVNPVGVSFDGQFHYMAYDSAGTLIVEGWFTVDAPDPEGFTGEWRFNKIGSPENIGPQVGEGRLIGGYREDDMWIELQPEYADNNLSLSGTYDGTRFTGTWQFIGFPGVLNTGSFEAERVIDGMVEGQ